MLNTLKKVGQMKAPVLPLAALLFAAACGEQSKTEEAPAAPPAVPAETPSVETSETVPQTPAQTPALAADPQPAAPLSLEERLAAADLESGRRQFMQCRSCHTLGEGERHLTGPNLWGVVGAAAGAREDYKYSDNLKNSGVVWDLASLYDFIERPNTYMPGSKMVFRGIPDGKRRADLLAYLISETSAP